MSTEHKRLKDPIYGYVNIEKDIMDKIIDTANFQRLRNILQTSYSPLYSTAVHNRFVHSIGVFYLGKIAADSFLQSFTAEQKADFDLEEYCRIFKLACLLHDVGHAPFSHTGEDYYLDADASRDELHNILIELTMDNDLKGEIAHQFKDMAAPHELMSAIVGTKIYGEEIGDYKKKSFFVRCITGYRYALKSDIKHSVYNCLISLLNSSIIDVDKLDYLIRDAYMTGFDTVKIDYERLLQSIRIYQREEHYILVFGKAAVSVIENVVLAHDAERKWIQNHPVVQYESYLLKHGMEVINKSLGDIKLFSYDYLTKEGKAILAPWKISLLSDDDIVFLMKNHLEDKLIFEYFSRKDRRHPIWKSESEYKAIFSELFTAPMFEVMEEEFEDLEKYLNTSNSLHNKNNVSSINEKMLESCKKDIEMVEKLKENSIKKNQQKFEKTIQSKRKHIKWMEALEAFAHDEKIEFDFIIIKENQFNSGFGKVEFGEIKIIFPNLSSPKQFSEVTNVLNSKKSDREKFFYLYYRRNEGKNSVNGKKLARKLHELTLQEMDEN